MKLSFGVFICLMVLKSSSAHSVTIECNFHITSFKHYECLVKNNETFTGKRASIEKVIGKHLEGKSDDDVQAFMLSQASNLKYFPKNLNNVFKNLIKISVHDTNLAGITSKDLKVFPKLKFLSLHWNQIEVIRDGTFDFNQELEFINLNHNKISHIDSYAFSKLPKLEDLLLAQNVCEFLWAEGRVAVLHMIEKIEQGSCHSDKIETTAMEEENTENSSIQNSRNFLLLATSCMLVLLQKRN